MTERRQIVKEDVYQRLFQKQRNNDNDIFDLKLSEIEMTNKLKNYTQLQVKMKDLLKTKDEIVKETSVIKSNANESLSLKSKQLEELKRKNAKQKEINNQADIEYNNLRETRDKTIGLIEEQNKEISSIRNRIEEIYSKLEMDNSEQYTLIQEKNNCCQSKLAKATKKKRYIEENKRLSYECKLKNDLLKKSQRENEKLTSELNAITQEVLSIKEEITEKNSDSKDLNELNMQLNLKLVDIERELNCLSIESHSLKDLLLKERNAFGRDENKRNQLETVILDKEKQINVLICQLDHENEYAQMVENDIEKFQLERDKMSNHLSKLKQNNALLNQEIKVKACKSSYIEEQKSQNSFRLSDLYSENRSLLNESIKCFNAPDAKQETYNLTVHNLHKGD